ncbi:MAG: GxxExxY protein [Verrucomicrobiota bacterium]
MARDFLYSDETRAIIGCSFEVLNGIGHGLHEKIYENALVVEFGLQKIPYSQQPHYDVRYKNVQVGRFIPDLITYEKIIVDTKTIDKITEHEHGKMLNYLKVTGLQVGLILNFKRAKLEWIRVART